VNYSTSSEFLTFVNARAGNENSDDMVFQVLNSVIKLFNFNSEGYTILTHLILTIFLGDKWLL
jgi:hypothetical protein